MGKSATGVVSPSETTNFSDLFEVKNSNGNRFLAKRLENGALAYLFVLKKQVFQRRNRKLMPTDEALARGIFQRVSRMFRNAKPLLNDGKAI